MGEVQKGQKVKLFLNSIDDSEKEIDCFIKDVQKDRLSLGFTKEILNYAEFLEEGSELPVRIYTPSGVKTYSTIIIDSVLEDDFVIEFIEDCEEIQRRAYPRINLETKVIIQPKGYGNIVTRTLDISEGGIRFFYEGKLEPKEPIIIMLYLPKDIRSIMAEGVIIESNHLPENQHVAVFTKIKTEDRDKIVKMWFDLQAKQYDE